MAAFLATFKLILTLLPLVVQAIRQVEAMHPQAGAGAHKLALVKGLVADAAAGAPGVEATAGQIATAVEAIANRVVGFSNSVGIFKKSSPPPGSAAQ